MKRVNVVGTSGTGKSTFCRRLSEQMQCQHIEMDALFWQPNWQSLPDEQFFTVLQGISEQDSWVLDGNYKRTEEIKWQRVDTVIWLDYSFPRTFYYAIKRAIIRVATKQELWPGTGNVESFRQVFLSKDSIILWTLSTFFKNRRHYKALMASPQYQSIKFVRLTSPKEAQEYLNRL